MLRYIEQDFLGRVVEKLDFTVLCRVVSPHLFQHLDHHVVGRLINDRHHDVLSVDQELSVGTFLHGFFTDFEHPIPCNHIGQLVAEFFDIRLVDIDGFRRAHERECVVVTADCALVEILRNDLINIR